METNNPQTPDLAALLTKLRTAQPGSAEREEYLEDLSQRIRRGEYHPDPKKIASRLLDEALRKRRPATDDSTELE